MLNRPLRLIEFLTDEYYREAELEVDALVDSVETEFHMRPRGPLAMIEPTTDTSGLVSVSYITTYDVAVILPPRRLIKVTVVASFDGNTAGDEWEVLPTLDGGAINRVANVVVHTTGVRQTVTGVLVHKPTAGKHTYGVAVTRQNGTGQLTHRASSSRPGLLLVEDIGPSEVG